MADVERLRAEHVALRVAAQRLLTVAESDAGYRAVAPGLLCKIVELLDDHGESEATVDFAALSRKTTPSLADRVLSFQLEWGDFIDAWPTVNVARDWRGFSAAARDILPRLIEVIEAEDALLADLPEANGTRIPTARQ